MTPGRRVAGQEGPRLRGCLAGGSAAGSALTLIHTNKVPNPMPMRVCGRLTIARSSWEQGRVAYAAKSTR